MRFLLIWRMLLLLNIPTKAVVLRLSLPLFPATMPMFLISSVPQEGLYLAHLSAAATVASIPVILVGWIAQRSLVRGLSMGAIK